MGRHNSEGNALGALVNTYARDEVVALNELRDMRFRNHQKRSDIAKAAHQRRNAKRVVKMPAFNLPPL